MNAHAFSSPADPKAAANQANNRDVRNLANLGETASTSRVLSLSQVYLQSAREKEYQMRPFFRDSQLNKCILVKHTLRANERDLFARAKRTATKIILPFDPLDLKLGGRSIFVNQTGFDAFCRAYFNIDDVMANADVQMLRLLDQLPSLDPFLVREHLGRNGFKPGACYLKISPFDVQRMVGFANAEIERLVVTAFGDGFSGEAGVKLTGKILADELDKELSPLRRVLRMSEDEFSDGIFSWRGFLYFKWRHLELQEEMRKVLEGLASYQPVGSADEALKEYLREVRPRLARKIVSAIQGVGRTLNVYDQAYHALVQGENAGPFRRFLLDGPRLFFELGENIGILSHIGSFWQYRMSQAMNDQRLTPTEYSDILMDFEDSLSVVGNQEEDA
ncbi:MULTISPECIES: hypothetical protein [Asticcacaulis]|uniref:hypothetical protein n=1 Tax=Asticcacaulis TaxID=76890 RepID=UPI001AEB83A1|nr:MULTISPECIES: hypothetical protein [Asticcacaulis]MBP2159244.1 hypothetical protein [Asticcacaulis solisilvae]MDR6800289.1 hypothetical protein [Asticcacaulis sp. BE141]